MDYNKYKEEVNFLSKALEAYEKGNSILSDKEYTIRIRALKEYENNNPSRVIKTSPSIVISTDKNNRYKHIYPMYSMTDAFNQDEVTKWLGIVNCKEYILVPKFDGMSLNILYVNGRRVFGATRGNGSRGENVTTKLDFIKNIPNKIEAKGKVEIRGEVCMTREEFLRLNDTGSDYKNPRNATAGIMSLDDIEEFKKRELVFLPWDMKSESIKCITYEEVLDKIWSYGFKRYDKVIATDIKEIESKYQYYDKRQEAFKIDYDGLVVRVNNLEEFKDLGVAGKYPKGLIAYKFSTEEKVAKVTSLTIQVGRTGAITPVAIIEPTEICGTTVERATLHNWRHVEKLGISVGSDVLITKSGGIIPKILTVLSSDGKCYVKPKRCPICLSTLVDDGITLNCINENCKGKDIQKLIYFTSRERMDINGLGPSMVNLLFDKCIVKTFEDLYNLDYDDLSKLNLGEVTISNLLTAIEKSKGVSLSTLLGSLGIHTAGKRVWTKILKHVDDVFTMSMDDLVSIPGIGDSIARNILIYITKHKDMIKRLMSLVEVEKDKSISLKYQGRVFYMTGALDRPRKVISEEITLNGGIVSKTLNSNITDFLKGKNAADHKVRKAKELKLNIIDKL